MRYHVLACDYDGTLATHGVVGDSTIDALKRCRESGRKLMLVTGRELPEMRAIFPHLDLFDRVVAENGALLYDPLHDRETPLAAPPPLGFLQAIVARGVAPYSVGRVVVATWQPHETAVLAAIQELGLELQVIFNKGAVMVLPSGVNKATGMKAALKELHLSPHNVVGVADAENDHSFLSICEASVAVDNALPSLKERVDWVTPLDHGAGVEQLIAGLLADDLAALAPRLRRHHLTLGYRDDDRALSLAPYGQNLLVASLSPGNQSTFVLNFMDRLGEAKRQYCAISPEGDLALPEGVVAVGTQERAPAAEQTAQVFAESSHSALVTMAAVPMRDRPTALLDLMERLQALRRATGRPHWILVDRAHQLLPSMLEPSAIRWPESFHGLLIVTQQASSLAPAILKTIGAALIGENDAEATITALAKACGVESPSVTRAKDRIVLWRPRDAEAPVAIRLEKAERMAINDALSRAAT